MKTLMQWLRLHPIKAVIFTMIFTAIATSAAFREDLTYKLVGTYSLFLGLWCLIFTLDMRKVMALLLAGLFSYTPAKATEPPPQENVAAVGVGVVIVCVGGYCVYQLIKVCQKKFPPPSTNPPPEELTFNAVGTDEYGASWDYSSIGSCMDGDSNTLLPTDAPYDEPYIATLNCHVDEDGNLHSKISVVHDLEGMHLSRSWTEFQSDVASHGLMITGRGDGGKHYAIDGVPCGPESVPLEFNEQTHAIVHRAGEQGRRITIERSRDFQNWNSFLTVTTPFGSGFQAVDLTRQGQMFYRFNVE